MKNKYIYRGVSENHYNHSCGVLHPAKCYEQFERRIGAGEEIAYAGSGMQAGYSASNGVLRHQFKQAGFPTSGISTTPHYKRAIFYATHGGQYNTGYIYKIDRLLLKNNNVREYIVSDLIQYPSVPKDNEIILVSRDYGDLPNTIIVSIEKIHI